MLLILLLLAASPTPGSIELPGGPPVSMDLLAYDAKTGKVWVPAGNTGRVDVIDTGTSELTSIEGFSTTKVTGRDGQERVIGPSAAGAGDGFVYIGNRAGSQVCAVDAHSLEKRDCVEMPSPPDGVAWVETTKEVWVTMPRDGSIAILDAKDGSSPKVAGRIAVAHPEGYAVDPGRGLFYTNQEEEDQTVVVDVRRREILGTWHTGCGEGGPRGLALDIRRRHLFVACSASIRVLDAARNGALLGKLQIGEGPDGIDYLESKHLVYAAAGRAGTLTVAKDSGSGKLTKVFSAPAAPGGRVVVVDARGVAYVADSKGGRILVLKPSEERKSPSTH